jgi:myo-inositol-1(or 4)-monophosphatase
LIPEERIEVLTPTSLWNKHDPIIETVRLLCDEVRSVVRPHLGSAAAKGLEGHGASGDTTFAIDEVAEAKVAEFLDDHEDIACYTEDRGLIAGEGARYLLVIDPIDGTRPAAAGLESCCVSVAVAPFSEDTSALTLRDVFLGIVREIKNDAWFTGLRGAGARIEVDASPFEPHPSRKTSLARIFWTAGYRGRPAEPLTTVLCELIDMSSVDGGYFDLGSATFSITRVVKGEMDVYIDVGQRMADEVESVRRMFLEVGGGSILNNYPYDLAAAALIAEEAGAAVSDAYGRSLDSYPLIPSGGGGQMSSVVSGNTALHEAVLEELGLGMARLAARYGARQAGLDGEQRGEPSNDS